LRIKLFDAELKVMEVIWREGDITAKQIVGIMREQFNWNKNSTYTMIKRCVEKGAIERIEPNFVCRALVSKEEAQNYGIDELANKLFDGSPGLLFASLLEKQDIPEDMLKKLKDIVNSGGDNG